MENNWYEIPVRVVRGEETLVVPANEVQSGDKVWFGTILCTTKGAIPDDEEEVMYIIMENGIDCWPAAMFR